MAGKKSAGDVTKTDSDKWLRRVIPLPKEFAVEGHRVLRSKEIGLVASVPLSPPVLTAIECLATFARCVERKPLFTIRLALADDKKAGVPKRVANRLGTLPNSAQAYAIIPYRRKRGELLLVGNMAVGLIYAARLVSQLVGRRQDEPIELPLVRVTDWPDIGERGQWGGNAVRDLAWTSQWRLNVIEASAEMIVDESGKPVLGIDRALLRQGERLAVKVVPFIPHLEQIAQSAGVTNRNDVVSTPDPSKSLPSDYVPGLCMSSPATRKLLAGWFAEAAGIEGVTDLMVWLSEDAAPCYCRKCMNKEPFELEVYCIARAFQEAKSVNPGIRLRILLTQGSYRVNDKVLAAAPKDVGITYYDGGRTYDSSRNPMIYPLLEEFARSGRWLGVYPQVTHCWRTVFPWTGPQFIHYRASEFVKKELNCVIGYAVPSNRYHEFNVMALAEWTWNANGRSPEDFAKAYATVTNICDPELFAEWAGKAGDAGWDLAESQLLLHLIYDPALGLHGDVSFDHRFEHSALIYPDRLNSAIEQADEALALARQAGVPDMVEESECLLAGLRALGALQAVSEIRGKTSLREDEKGRMVEALDELDTCACILQTRLPSWATRISARDGSKTPTRLRDTANVLSRTCDAVRELASSLGIPDPRPDYRMKKLGSWSASNFAKGSSSKLRFEVSGIVGCTAGAYYVGFTFDGGAYGSDIDRVALVAEREGRQSLVTESQDLKQRVSRYERWHELLVEVPEIPTGAKLLLEIELTGIPDNAPLDRRTCSGSVSIRRASSFSADFLNKRRYRL